MSRAPLPDAGRDAAGITAFYQRGHEQDRLASGDGALEFARTRIVLEQCLPPAAAVVADVGGGPGRYAVWLAERGYQVHLVDFVSLHVEQARATAREAGVMLASAATGDARALPLPDQSADAVLLLGPLYHLSAREERIQAWTEAARIARHGAPVVAAAISRFASVLDGMRGGYLEDPVFAAIASEDLRVGQHRNPTADPKYFTTAYFHRPEELAEECEAAGLVHERTVAVEGPAWLLPDLDDRLGDERRRSVLLAALASVESEPALLGVSAHLIAVSRRR